MIDSHYKGRNFSPDSMHVRLFLPLFLDLLPFKKKMQGGKKVRPRYFFPKVSIGGQGFVLKSYVCSRGPSPCSRPCICTCKSLACCSRWRSCCSGSVLKSTHPHLKDNGNITTLNFWVLKASDITAEYWRIIASLGRAESLSHTYCQWKRSGDSQWSLYGCHET